MHKNHYRLVAIDVDGTLLNSNNQVSSGAAEAIGQISDCGIHAILVSGRSILMLRDYVEALRVSPYYIGSGGAKVGKTSGEVIAFTPVQRVDAEAIAHKARRLDLGICLHESIQQHCEIKEPNMRARLQGIGGSKINFVDDVLISTTNEPEKITVFGEREVLERLRLELLRGSFDISMTYSGPLYLEITRCGVSKGKALQQLIKYLHIAPQEVAAIGDQQNDISMFKIAGLSIAMGNAPDEVKSVASIVAPTNDEGGLAWALRELVLKGSSKDDG